MYIINRFDIHQHEGGKHKGHTIERHVGKTKEWLKYRAKNSKIKGATSFTDSQTANRMIIQTLADRFQEILDWLKDPNENLTKRLDLRFSEYTGYGFTRNAENYFEDIINIRIMLIRTSRFNFKLYTAYPTDERFKGE